MIEAGAPSTGGWNSADPHCCPKRCARPTGGTHGLTTEAFTLLISIGILLEIPKRPEPRRAPASPSAATRKPHVGLINSDFSEKFAWHRSRTTLRSGSWLRGVAAFLITNGVLIKIKSQLAKVQYTIRPFPSFVRSGAWQSPLAKWRLPLRLHNTPGDVPNESRATQIRDTQE
jgi:hypothetical protein